MLQLEALISQAQAEVSRQMQVCNACRYCETFCAVFPAMTRRLEFDAADTHYLANLCHNCGACLHACQYAPPHEFAINVPRAMAQVRQETYIEYAWPRPLGELYRRNGVALALATVAGLALFLVMLLSMKGSLIHQPLSGNFYAIFPHNMLVFMFGLAFGWAVLALGIGAANFWRGQSPGPVGRDAATEAARHALTLTYLDGGHGDGCNEESDRFTLVRRRFHHLTFYGFMLCFASTCVASVYHYVLGLKAPFAITSLPVVLGTLGGIGLLVGPGGLLWLNLRRDPSHGDPKQRPMDRAFIVLLFATSLTGLALLAWRDTGFMGLLLAIHLATVMALFLTLPYGKFAHAVYRCSALLKWAVEKRQPSRLQLGAD
ncbi:MAG: tricarballylate utilization 4Fe-4S protein TcuB [Burkholderiales bacterium]|nr:tricarballylate utilization 4Fe-4S protein TcuB [Burkholderiales bacterium]